MSEVSPTKYYQKKKNKKKQSKIWRKACERYQDVSEEEKNKKTEYGREWYKNLSQHEKQKLVE